MKCQPLRLCLLLSIMLLAGIISGKSQPSSTDTPEFYNVPLVKGIVILKSPDELKPDGMTDIEGIVVPNVPVLNKPKFKRVLQPYLGKPLNEETMQQLQRDIVLYCRSNDRPLVDVLYREQDVSNGVLQVIFLEAKLGSIKIQDKAGNEFTNGWTKASYLQAAMRTQVGDPIGERQVVSDLEWLSRRNPYRKVDLLYQSAGKFGESDLVLRIDERRPFSVFAGYEDTGSEVTDDNRILAGFSWANTFGLHDHLLNYQFTANPTFDQLRAHSASYSIPLPWRHSIRLLGSYVEVIGDVGRGITLEGDSYEASFRYDIPLPMINRYQHELSLGVDFKSSENALEFNQLQFLNTPTEIFQLMLGYNGAVSDRLGQTTIGIQGFYSPGDVTDKNTDEYFGGNGQTTVGAHQFAKAEYKYARASLDRTTRLPYDFSWLFRAAGQISDGNLLTSEQLGLGGYATVRGYEEREANGDQGWLISNELRTPSFTPTKLVSENGYGDNLQFLGFWDYGVTQNKLLMAREDPHEILSSIGLGVRYTIRENFSFRFDYGWQLNDTGLNDDHNGRAHLGAILRF
jgi:hemolysin activation/secretion protein